MIKNSPLIKTAGTFKDPAVRFILFSAIMIISALAYVIIYQSRGNDDVKREAYNNLYNAYSEVKEGKRKSDSINVVLINEKYELVAKDLENARQREAFFLKMDSIKTHQNNIQQIIQSK